MHFKKWNEEFLASRVTLLRYCRKITSPSRVLVVSQALRKCLINLLYSSFSRGHEFVFIVTCYTSRFCENEAIKMLFYELFGNSVMFFPFVFLFKRSRAAVSNELISSDFHARLNLQDIRTSECEHFGRLHRASSSKFVYAQSSTAQFNLGEKFNRCSVVSFHEKAPLNTLARYFRTFSYHA